MGMTLQELEKQMIIETLKTHHHNRMKVAQILGITPDSLQNKILEYNL